MHITDRFFTSARLAAALDGVGAVLDDDLFGALIEAYSEPHRFYHNRQHVAECLELAGDAEPEILVAIWFHDAVYDTHQTDNEDRSADWAKTYLTSQHVLPEIINRITAMIVATKMHEGSALLLDIDLAILGASPERFSEYNSAIRKEYHWVPDDQYFPARRQILESFLSRPAIYQTPQFQKQFKAAARRNLTAAIAIF